jgi:hypothetical protein
MVQGLIEAFISRNASWCLPAIAFGTLIRTTRLAASFTRYTFLAQGPIAVLRKALDVRLAVILQNCSKQSLITRTGNDDHY